MDKMQIIGEDFGGEDPIKSKLVGMIDQMFGRSIAAAAQEGKEIFFDHDEGRAPDSDYLDSLDRVELVMAAEEEFGVEVPDVIAKSFKTIDDAASYIATVTSGPLHGGH